MKQKITALAVIFSSILLSSCSEFLNIEKPRDHLVKPAVFTSDRSAEAALTGIYGTMSDISSSLAARLHLVTGLYSDELSYTGNEDNYDQMLTNNIQSTSGIVDGIWTDLYKYIYYVNSVLEGLEASDDVSDAVRTRLTGEAKLIRAFCYFYLCNLWGEVPLIISSDYRKNESLPRTPLPEVYAQIINDLQEAGELLVDIELTGERTRPDKYAAAALLARVYLFREDWEKAAQAASYVIQSGKFSLEELADCFLKDSHETIWQLASVNPDYNTFIGQQVIPASETQIPYYPLSESFGNSFEEEDQRPNVWTDTMTAAGIFYRYPYKYKIRTGSDPLEELLIVSRLAELYLIRAEAFARTGKLSQATEALNKIRRRAGLTDVTAESGEELLLAIERERRTELFLEWGHRWFDLKRTGRAGDLMEDKKGSDWQPDDLLWPIPLSQIEANPYLSQNIGY